MAVINLENDSTYSALVVHTDPPFYSFNSSINSPYQAIQASNRLYYAQGLTFVYPFNNSSKFPVGFDLNQKPFVAFLASQGEILFAEQNLFYQPPPSQGLPSGRIGFFGPISYLVSFNHPYYPNTIFFGTWTNIIFSLSIPFDVNTDTALFSVKVVYKSNTDQLLFLFTCNNSGYSTTPQFTASYILNRPSDFPLFFYPEIAFWRGHYFAVNY